MPKKLVEAKLLASAETGSPRWRRGRRRGTCRHSSNGCHGSWKHKDEAPLSEVPAGTWVEVTRLTGDESLRGRIMALGIVPGAAVGVVSGGWGRPLVLALPQSRLLLDARTSQSILVRDSGTQTAVKTGSHEGGMEQ